MMSSQFGCVIVCVNVKNVNNVYFLGRDWLMMLMMSSTNGGFERLKVRLVLVDEFLSVYRVKLLRALVKIGY